MLAERTGGSRTTVHPSRQRQRVPRQAGRDFPTLSTVTRAGENLLLRYSSRLIHCFSRSGMQSRSRSVRLAAAAVTVEFAGE
jgi:hypothetical protein